MGEYVSFANRDHVGLDWAEALKRVARGESAFYAMGWLTVAASRAGQDAFNVVKGAIPARTDPALERYDSYQRSAIADFKRSLIYPTYGAAMPATYVRGLEPALGAFAVDGDVAKAAATIAGLAASSAPSFTQVWALR